MSYIVNNSRGQIVAVVQEGTVNSTSTSVSLIGKNVTTYGERLAENTVFQLENFANTTPPVNPITGQLWWDIGFATMKVYNGSKWVATRAVYTDESAPTDGIKIGDLWFQPSTMQLRAYSSYAGATTWFSINNVPVNSSAPTVLPAGSMYFNTAEQRLYISNGAAWVLVSSISTLTPGQYITGSAFNGLTDVEWTIAAGAANSANTIVARNAQGDFAAGNVTAEITGNVTGTASNVTGVVAVANGGTGVASYAPNEILVADANGALRPATLQAQMPLTVEYVNSGAVFNYSGVSNIVAGSGIEVSISNGVATINNVQASGFVAGMIMIWTGIVPPTGWAVCNGDNQTPDLRDRFVMGFGSTVPLGAIGGTPDSIVVEHSHSISGVTSSAGAHQHNGVPWLRNDVDRGTLSSSFSIDNVRPTEVAGAHIHNVTGTAATEGVPGEQGNLPPYYALAYIMKL